ncbi:MAG TPA: hypothetical protein VF510_19320 [Ktedonobacterales bacterium]
MNILRPQISLVVQIILAIILGVGAAVAVERAGPQVRTAVLAVLLAACMFVLLGLARAFLLGRMARMRRLPGLPPGRGGRNGRGLSGVREPRRPRPPFMPPAEAAAEPEQTATSP